MSFNLEQFNTQLSAFGTVENSSVRAQNGECLEFVVVDITTSYTIENLSSLFINDIQPYFPNLINISIDENRIKGAFKKMI